MRLHSKDLVFAIAALATTALASSPGPADAQRLSGVVTDTAGYRVSGLIRWDAAGASPLDVLEGTRTLSAERARLIRAARGEEFVIQRRVLEVEGFRVSWDEVDPEFAVTLRSGVRMGSVVSAQRLAERSLLLTLTSGQVVELQVPGGDGGPGYEEIHVDGPAGQGTTVPWGAVASVEFQVRGDPVSSGQQRLRGTVEDRWGQQFAGAITWSRTVALRSDSIVGRDGEGVSLEEVRELRRTDQGSTEVTLTGGESRTLSGTRTTGRGHRGVEVMDPTLGRVRIPWRDVRRVILSPGDSGDHAAPRLDRLTGTVADRNGDERTGTIIWDGDEAWGWEFLDGEWRDLEFSVVFSEIDRIRRESSRSARVFLKDGRAFELRGSNDVSDGNRGILVTSGDPEDPAADWILVPWDELAEVRFHEIH